MGSTNSDKSFMIFGQDVSKMPCFRNSFLYGISGGLACGLIRFMLTSRPKSATDFAFGSFVVITMSYWFQCRYKYSKMNFEMARLKYQLQQHTLLEGTEADEAMQRDTDNELVDV